MKGLFKMRRTRRLSWLAATLLALGVPHGALAQSSLAEGFKNPPNEARPRVYWYWQNGNMTLDGLTKDLQWMKRAGIGGVETFDVAIDTPTVVDERLIYMTPGWKEAFRHSLELTDSLGLEVTIGAAPGWSQSGGPWVPPEQAMKKFVWTETFVPGGQPFEGVLPRPPSVNGPFQAQHKAIRPDRPVPDMPELYVDQVVVAFPAPAAERALPRPKVTSSGGAFTYEDLDGSDLGRMTSLPATPGTLSWIQLEYDSLQTIRGVSVGSDPMARFLGETQGTLQFLQVSNDGTSYRNVVDLPRSALNQRTIAFAPVRGRFFRYVLPATSVEPFPISRFELMAATPVNRFEEKAAFAAASDYYAIATPPADAVSIVPKDQVIDLTSKMQPDGTLDWTPPPGDWVVLRIGYSLTGHTNAPAPLEATGFEVDKLSKSATKDFMEQYLDLYDEASGGMMGERGVNNVATDSWEAGLQNWTDGMLDEFRRLRGYDPLPWLPALTGRVVQSSEDSDRFLWDFRRTIATLIVTSNSDQVRESLHERGLRYVTEAMAGRRSVIADTMEMKSRADVPMGELWLPTPDRRGVGYNYFADIRDTASVANIYGKPIASAESITSTGRRWGYGPWDLKATADLEFVGGINQFTLHVTVSQPNDNAPGLALSRYGQWFNRLDTWAEQARAWTDYIARSSFLMQQGQAVVDIAYFYGEEGPTVAINDFQSPQVPEGHIFDFVNSEILLNEFTIQNGHLVAKKSGMTYPVLYLGGTSEHMTLPVLRQIRNFVHAGAVVVGTRPIDSPSLADDGEAWQSIVEELWPGDGVVSEVGKGRIYQTKSIARALLTESIEPDLSYERQDQDTKVLFYHRATDEADIYFVNNRADHATSIDATFRVAGKAPEIWRADTGKIQPASYTSTDGRTTVPLALEPRDAVFVVFAKPATSPSRTVREPLTTPLAEVNGPWDVSFEPNRGAPETATFSDLTDWTQNADPGIKYFSGVATYTKTVSIPPAAFDQHSRLELDLGTVHEIAEVAVNGVTAGITWKPPYRVDVTDALEPGTNALSIKVVNLWPNRLIGDEQPGAERIAFAPNSNYESNSPLLPSGLLGPVVINKLTSVDSLAAH